MPDRAAALVRDIEAIPGVLDRMAGLDLRASFRDLVGGTWRPRRVVLTGLGSSRFAALDVEADLLAFGINVTVEPASTDRPAEPSADCLCVAISSSGRTPEAVVAAERHLGVSRVLAVTRDAKSPLAATADSVTILPVEAEESGVATTTYVATLAVLRGLVAAITEAESPDPSLARAAADAQAVLASRDAWLLAAQDILSGVESLTVLAPWSERGAAEQIALLFREAPRRSADVAETAEWLHTGIYTALPGSVVLVLVGSPADEEAARTIVGRSGQVLAIGGVTASLLPHVAAVIPSTSGPARILGPALVAAELWRAMPGPLG